MKKIWKTYRVFYSPSQRLLFPAVTILLLLLHSYMISFLGTASFSLTAGMLFLADTLLDFFVFGGIASKGTPYGILKTSPDGAVVLCRGILLDMLRRFLQYAVTISLTAIAANCMDSEMTHPLFIKDILLCLLLLYAESTLLLIVLRCLVLLLPYTLLISLSSIGCIISMNYVLSCTGWISALLIVLLAAAGVLLSLFSLRYILRQYQKSFHDMPKTTH